MRPTEPYVSIRKFALNRNNITTKPRDVLLFMKHAAEVLGQTDVANALAVAAVQYSRHIPRRRTPRNETQFVAGSYQLINHIFTEVAKELTGRVTPRITSNEIIRAFAPIVVDYNGNFKLIDFQIQSAISMLTGGEHVERRTINQLVRIYTVPQFGLRSLRTTITMANPELLGQYERRERAMVYEGRPGAFLGDTTVGNTEQQSDTEETEES